MPPLREPETRRLRGFVLGLFATVVLLTTVLFGNFLQMLTLIVRPFSPRAFSRLNREIADAWWGLCVILSVRLHGIQVRITGDALPMRENVIVFANHQEMADVVYLFFLARRQGRLGDLKWMVKDPVKYVPGVGWGMAFLDCIFVKRTWAEDQASIERTFARLIRRRVPMWLGSFPEGTRQTPEKLEKSRAYAESKGLPVPRHVMIPRTKGFVASVQGMRGHATAVYDLTIGYPDGAPTMWQYIKGFAPLAHLHVRRFPIAELPEGEEALAAWLMKRFEEKDRLLAGFYERGAFDAEPSLAVERAEVSGAS